MNSNDLKTQKYLADSHQKLVYNIELFRKSLIKNKIKPRNKQGQTSQRPEANSQQSLHNAHQIKLTQMMLRGTQDARPMRRRKTVYNVVESAAAIAGLGQDQEE